MNKVIKYGLVAGLTMAAFSLAGVPASSVYAADGECAVTAGDNYTYAFSDDCVLNSPIAAIAPAGTSDWIHDRATLSGKTYTFNVVGLDAGASYKVEIYADGDDFAATYEDTFVAPERSVTKVSDTTYTYAYQDDSDMYAVFKKQGAADYIRDKAAVTKGENGSGTIVFDLSGLEEGTYEVEIGFKQDEFDAFFKDTFTVSAAVELESVEAEINDDEIVLTYNTGYEGTPELAFAVEADFADVVTVENGVVKVAEAYKTAVNHDVEITVKATDGEIVKTTTVTYTIEANYTEVEAAFADGEDEMTIKVDGEAVIKVTGVEGVKYTYDYDEWDLVFEEKTNTFTVDPDYMSDEDREFTIMVNGFVAGESDDDAVVLESKELKLTVKANVKNNQTEKGSLEVLEGDGQEAVAKDGVSFRIDAPISTFSAITVMNEELYERYYNGEELTDEELASMAFCSYAWCGAAGDFSIAGKLVEGEDYILEEGSTIVTFTESFLKKLLPGTYTVGVSFADYTDLTNITFDNAVTSFTLLGSPDTGAATAVKTGAASSALATVLAAVAAAGAAVVAKFAKRK